MNKNTFSSILAGALFCATSSFAQETYESAQLATQDLNGTARYIGMGGAMEALGADISTISSNPAGIGLFRKSWMGISAGATVQKGNDNVNNIFNDTGKTNADLNQVGFVFSVPSSGNSYLNLGFNFSKSRNFNQILTATADILDGSSLNKKADMDHASLRDKNDMKVGPNVTEGMYTVQDQLIYKALNSQLYDSSLPDPEGYYGANRFAGMTDYSGYIGSYDFNISGNINNQIFLGFTLGLKSVHYNSETWYDENLISTADGSALLSTADYRRIRGNGIDIKLGAIFRPIADSPFRFGVYFHTPTWYRLTMDTNQEVDFSPNSDYTGPAKGLGAYDSYTLDYNIVTPWRFGASIGHTFDQYVALGATYEYAKYGSIDNREVEYRTTTWRDHWGWYETEYENSWSNKAMNQNTKFSLKGVHLLKVGAEIKPVPEVAIRMGYNYQSAIYEKKGTKDCIINSDGSFVSTSDYTNWGDTHRVTFGLGFKVGQHVNLDFAYQYATQKGEYHPFESNSYTESATSEPEFNNTQIVNVKNDRHQISCTLGYRF